ncbi:MAG: chloride channel protein [Arhodomonas sp.]|nr:chloride channel protein [Arhodomonas sp.]
MEAALPWESSGTAYYALLGMGAMMGACLRAPLAALTAMLELTADPGDHHARDAGHRGGHAYQLRALQSGLHIPRLAPCQGHGPPAQSPAVRLQPHRHRPRDGPTGHRAAARGRARAA